jgi:hypothetical protein
MLFLCWNTRPEYNILYIYWSTRQFTLAGIHTICLLEYKQFTLARIQTVVPMLEYKMVDQYTRWLTLKMAYLFLDYKMAFLGQYT